MSDAFFHRSRPTQSTASAELLIADAACTGPWSADAMHGGPPAALLVRACEQVVASATDGPSSGGPALTALRASIDFLAPVPLGSVEVRARVVRGGRRVALAEAVLSAGGREVLHARTWLLRAEAGPDPAVVLVPPTPEPRVSPYPAPEACSPALTTWEFPYARAMEWRHVSGAPSGPGDAAAWARPRIPLVDDEVPTGLQAAVLVADSGNGISASLDWDRWSFVNVDLVVHLSRPVEGDWVLMDARSRYAAGGTGLATSVLHDRSGALGTGAQTLLVSPR